MGTILPHALTRAGCSAAITEGSVTLSRTALGTLRELWSQPAQLGAAVVDRLCNTVIIASTIKEKRKNKNETKNHPNGLRTEPKNSFKICPLTS